jgi:MtN3 and saliva related transmembrane protein
MKRLKIFILISRNFRLSEKSFWHDPVAMNEAATGRTMLHGRICSMDMVTLLGMAAGTLTTISFLPQVIKTWKTRSTKDISSGMFSLFCAGIFLWILYGFSISSLPVIVTNIVTFILACIILALKLRNG